jgi:hypothetical protein
MEVLLEDGSRTPICPIDEELSLVFWRLFGKCARTPTRFHKSKHTLPDLKMKLLLLFELCNLLFLCFNRLIRLPHMAKSLEEHLYRSAQTKEEYLDPSTLKKRLQLIAHGLELHRSTSASDTSAGDQNNNSTTSGNVPSEAQQLQQFLQMQGGNMNFNQSGAASRNSIASVGVSSTGGASRHNSVPGGEMMLQGLGGLNDNMSNFGGTSSPAMDDSGQFNDQVALQKKKVIRQQQQRLLLLRHASKCKEGANCKTKFCPQMMTLWKHMKICRDKSCKTPHCLSSRCVLNHYRICKSQGRTATCEVCGPVMDQIKSYDVNDTMDSSDPLAAKSDQNLPQLQQQMSSFGNVQQHQQQQLNNSAQAMQQQAMQQLYQKQQQAIQQNQNQQVPNGMGMQNTMENLNSAGGGSLPTDELQNSQGSNQLQQQQSGQQQPQNLQNLQQKLQQLQQVLRQLQKQQAQLLEQQKHLKEQQQLLTDPGTQQGQQLQQQHALLQQLQRRCQQQQALIQQELMMTVKGIQEQQGGNQQMGNNSQGSQPMSNNSQHSQQNQMPMQNNTKSPNLPPQNQNQLQSQMEALSQSHMEALNSPKGTDDLNSIGNLQNQLNKDPLQQDLLSQPLGGDEQQSQKEESQEQSEEQSSDPPVSGSPTDPFGSVGQLDSGDKTYSKDETSAPKIRSSPGLSRGKGARGRGGKGKRLRDIADDLLPAESAAVVRAGGSISLPSADGDSSRKRSAGEVADGEDEPAQKTSKTDWSAPDAEKSGDLRLGNGEGSEKKYGDNDPNASLASSMPKGDVEQNLMLLHKGLHLTSRTITHKCLPIVQQLIDDPFGWVFRDAVDPVVFGLPDYFEVVKNPMHLLLVKKKLENAVYTDMASFERDVKLVFENAILYNGEDSEVGQLAHTMMGVFEKEYKKVCEGM